MAQVRLGWLMASRGCQTGPCHTGWTCFFGVGRAARPKRFPQLVSSLAILRAIRHRNLDLTRASCQGGTDAGDAFLDQRCRDGGIGQTIEASPVLLPREEGRAGFDQNPLRTQRLCEDAAILPGFQ